MTGPNQKGAAMLSTIPADNATITPPPPVSARQPRGRKPLALLRRLRNRSTETRRVLISRLAAARADQSGNVITDNLAWIVFGVVIIAGLATLITTVGSDVIKDVTNTLGV
jgi:hypothetical protein